MKFVNILVLGVMMTFLSACSVLGQSNVETAPYKTISTDGEFELRHYDSLIVVSAPMPGGMDAPNNAFRELFGYISGDNNADQKIAMTAPVFMGLDNQDYMQFVMPADLTIETTPLPEGENVSVEEIKGLNVAVIGFSGRLTERNVKKNRGLLEDWIAHNDTVAPAGKAIAAGYNGPFTIPAMRRNEVLIPVEVLK